MGGFTNGLISRIFSVLLSMLLIAVNIYFVISYVIKLNISHPLFILFIVLIGIVYLLFCLYLTTDMVSIHAACSTFINKLFQMLAMGSSHLASLPLVRKLFSTSTTANNYAIHEEDGDDSGMDDVEEQTDDGDVQYR